MYTKDIKNKISEIPGIDYRPVISAMATRCLEMAVSKNSGVKVGDSLYQYTLK